ncbi:MAG TPA: type II toxin-antitoxin system RelE/ParE family toxin [Candidatus Bathyarchaeia archaeon]|nr:type II toxin-antitoxin system RelE/ParE family toxin [Candidatus Bathyarchaeia archaeon]
MRVFLSRKAKRALDNSPVGIRRRLEERIAELLETPFPSDCRKLKGAQNAYRLRIGDYRILYVIVSNEEILVFRIARREVVYR